jgi:hypothetical protein
MHRFCERSWCACHVWLPKQQQFSPLVFVMNVIVWLITIVLSTNGRILIPEDESYRSILQIITETHV